MTSSALGRTIARVSARVFAHPKVSGGGNPVTVFLSGGHSSSSASSSASPDLLSPAACSALARSCEWESVIAHVPTDAASEQGQRPVLSFYMPSGEEVAFCAHAAMGAAAVIAQDSSAAIATAGNADTTRSTSNIDFTTTADETPQRVTISSSTGEAELQLTAVHTEEDIPDFKTLGELREALGLHMDDVSLGGTGLPSYINSSIARNKTLFPMLDVKRLHSATNPPDADRFRDLCDKVKSTGIYLYSPIEGGEDEGNERNNDGAAADVIEGEVTSNGQVEVVDEVLRYECRQFPRYSGYPEDPATGIAAAALATSLRRRGFGAPSKDDKNMLNKTNDNNTPAKKYRYEFYQGTRMQHSSKIGVRFEESDEGEDTGSKEKELKVYISGLVDISSKDEVDIPAK